MKLVTFQSFDALKDLINKGYLECSEDKIDKEKVGKVYDWIIEKMNNEIDNPLNTRYPLWCWVKCYNGICPPKKKGKPVQGFDVKITFNKNKEDVFVTDFRRYSFLLNNLYIPVTKKDKELFDNKLVKNNITKEELLAFVRKDKFKSCRTDEIYISICQEIRKSFDRCITYDSDILQGCIWRINLSEIEKIEIMNRNDYVFGSLNYLRSNGKRMNWIEDYYHKIKE